jgi:hypothetical protein
MSHPYLEASSALWAGDYARDRELFGAPFPSSPAAVGNQQAMRTSDLLANVLNRRAKQLQRAERRFREAVAGLPPEGRSMTSGGLPIRGTAHLQAVLSRTSIRHFEMRAYLRDFAWSKQLLANAKRLALPQTVAHVGSESEISSTGHSWEVPGDLFLEIHVNRLGLIGGKGFWTPTPMPNGDRVIKAFQEILEQLDPEERR